MKKIFQTALRTLSIVAVAALSIPTPTTSLAADVVTTNAPRVTTAVVTRDICATSAQITLPGYVGLVTVYGYTTGTCTGGPALTKPGGVTLFATQGDVEVVRLHNSLPFSTSLLFTGQAMPTDQKGVGPGGTKTYTFTASSAGTFLYESGLLPNTEYQIAMGLSGALVVRPAAAGTAYGTVSTAYDDEAVMVLGDIDPALNTSLTPAAFDMRDYAPKFYTINGNVYPATASIPTVAGHRVLLRYVNSGLQPYSITALGVLQTLVAVDGNAFPITHTVVAETMAPGETSDRIVVIPATAVAGARYALYDANLMLHNNTDSGFGGMLTFLAVGTAGVAGDVTGPGTSNVALTANPTDGNSDIGLTATVGDFATGGSNVQSAEYYIDNVSGVPTPLSALDGAFDSPTETVQVTISVASLATLSAGNHTLFVRGSDAAANWGPFNFITLNLDKAGPDTSALVLMPNPTNGTADVSLSGTASDLIHGGSIISAAVYAIDGGAQATMTVNTAAPVASLAAIIPAATVISLTEGAHTVVVTSQDSLNNWGMPATATLIVDLTGPAALNVIASPNPNNGLYPVDSSDMVVRLSATFSDALSLISAGEGFIDAVGINGQGFIFVPSDGVFDTAMENAYADIPLLTINSLSVGTHTLYVHARDSAGNWATATGISFVIDKTSPVISGAAVSPNPTNNNTGNSSVFTLTATATDAGTGGSNIGGGEWFEGADPGLNNGTPMSATDGAFNSSTEGLSAVINFVALDWAAGTHTVTLRAKDAAGNWSTTISTSVVIVWPNVIFADSFSSGNRSAWSGSSGTNLLVTSTASLDGIPAFGLRATVATGATRTPVWVIDNTPNAEASYHARFYFRPNSVVLNNNNSANGVTIFSGLNAFNTAIFQVQLRRQTAGNQYQARYSVVRQGGATSTNWFNISNATHYFEIAWFSAPSASVSFSIDGAIPAGGTLGPLDTSANTLESVRLGPSAGLQAGASGSMMFDAFVSTRRTLAGLLVVNGNEGGPMSPVFLPMVEVN